MDKEKLAEVRRKLGSVRAVEPSQRSRGVAGPTAERVLNDLVAVLKELVDALTAE